MPVPALRNLLTRGKPYRSLTLDAMRPLLNAALVALCTCLSATTATANVVDESLRTADALWEKTKSYADLTLERARELWQREQPDDAALWRELVTPIDEVIALQEREADLPASSWFGEDRVSNAAEIERLLDDIAQILIGDHALRNGIRELDRAMVENRNAITELKRRRLTAPSDSLWRKTVADIADEIADREALLAEQQRAMTGLQAKTAAILREKGLDIDADGLEFLLATIVGDQVLDMTLAFEQVRELTGQLEALMVESREDLVTARRYYGMYTVLLRTLDYLHGDLLTRMAEVYRPSIDDIRERALALQKETRSLNKRGPSPILEANLAAQQLTVEAAGRYAEYLAGQQAQVAESRERLARNLAIARNTYETVKMSGDLVALMQDSRHLLDTLFQLQIPPLRAFENLEMKREFERLTDALQTAEG